MSATSSPSRRTRSRGTSRPTRPCASRAACTTATRVWWWMAARTCAPGSGVVVLVLAAAAVLDLAHPFGSSPSHPFGTASTGTAPGVPADPPTTQAVVRRAPMSVGLLIRPFRDGRGDPRAGAGRRRSHGSCGPCRPAPTPAGPCPARAWSGHAAAGQDLLESVPALMFPPVCCLMRGAGDPDGPGRGGLLPAGGERVRGSSGSTCGARSHARRRPSADFAGADVSWAWMPGHTLRWHLTETHLRRAHLARACPRGAT